VPLPIPEFATVIQDALGVPIHAQVDVVVTVTLADPPAGAMVRLVGDSA
jgi:hypothetical protein